MPRLDPDECRRRFAAARHAYLATADLAAVPHLVPITFAVLDTADGDAVVWAVDHKPKATHALRRLRNVTANPRVALLADAYDDDWDRLWWVRADGTATIDDGGTQRCEALEALAARYGPYRDRPPAGPVVRVRVSRWSGWAARSV
ncbi:TIGR03668 family PPOX class F420-dependent oxidoreductase [Isoptericola chiayiensis]|uniref:TIGR03668 family PPOX class F420-dependent oxidoreductase n=1 Tax=Isoptericola chiayiensis TaxID=579446 RepID=A0ABP8YDS7_9MICO|nr:PPOX class probable F420-dependent enzyme [Isoptericola chiayiensis]